MLPDVTLDAGATGCGELTLLIFQAIKTLAPGQTLEVLAYDLAAEVDIPAWCRSTGNVLLGSDLDTRPKRFLIQKPGA
jgi:tRNA 2-thiouridine synthesizing protein A